MTREENWILNYQRLRDYVDEHHQFPDKKKVENRALLNWWKYNVKLLKSNKLDEHRLSLLQELSDMRLVHGRFAEYTKKRIDK